MIGRRLLWSVGALLSLLVVVVASAYLRLDPDTYFPQQRAVYLTRELPLLLHIGGGMLALGTLPWQLAGPLRRRFPRGHRWTGRLYVAGVAVGAAGGLALAPTAYGGAVSGTGFALLAITWATTTALGLAAARRGDIAAHRRWMTRSAAVTFAAVTLRLILGTHAGLDTAGLAPVTFETTYRAAAWLSWLPNLLAAEWVVRSARVRRTRPGRALVRSAG
jgi:uncharacterized membrane protein